jgi:drug/metabolite transporter (DMT)-like permease
VTIPDTLTPTVTLLVLGAGVLHAIWNAIASAIRDKALTFGLIGATATIAALVILPIAGMPNSAALPYAAVSGAIHVGYNYSLLRSYRLGHFGQAYPLARGTSPLLVAVGAWLIAGEGLVAVQILGVLAVGVGLMSIVFAGGRLRRADLPATLAAVLTGVTIASYTVVDGLGVRHSGNPVGYLAIMFAMQGPVIAGVSAMLLRGRLRREHLRDVPAGVTAGLLSMLAYGIVIWAQTKGPLALVAALRETSVISAALIATLLFHEPFGRRRIVPAAVVVAGIILISL